ncbi:MAG: hypothetical protein Q4D12_10640 [Bacteroidales bacterium]|nr:hypothetical protein [Bacteroidales bacterium]
MGLFSNIFGKKKDEPVGRVGGMEDFMSLIRVYYQCIMASNLGITNLAFLPDLRMFKQTLKIPTVNNKLGVGEKNKCKKMLQDLYGLNDNFFKEIDASVKKNCRNANDIKQYLIIFQGFSQDLLMLMGNLMQWKFRLPAMFKKMLFTMTQKTVGEILTKNDWSDEGVAKTCRQIRKYQGYLGFSQEWITEYVYDIVMLAKKEPKPADDDTNLK